MVSKVKNLELGTGTPSVFKDGCPFAKDAEGKPIVTPEYIEYPYSLTVEISPTSARCLAKGEISVQAMAAAVKVETDDKVKATTVVVQKRHSTVTDLHGLFPELNEVQRCTN
ncbi:hypothetical protein OS493_018812 [Desmophyllum pertusum]|uniref:Uncharacterized protein n=1 Tax=Desmophyllum pertusum TaxID=174260 RepID=A0A9X0CYG3_9CNID|nr:hypothetical protein OS493_018812 [Desmophyllum pertusum]